MKFITAFLIVMFSCCFNNESTAQVLESNPVKLSIANHNVSNDYDMVLSARFMSKWQEAIAVPRRLNWGLLGDSVINDFFLVEIQMKIGEIYKKISLDGRIDNLPADPVDSLYEGDSVFANSFSIDDLFNYKIGSYRVRVLCRLSVFNPGMKDIYSNWAYFRCVKDRKHFGIEK